MNSYSANSTASMLSSSTDTFEVQRSTKAGMITLIISIVLLGLSISMPFWAGSSYLRLFTELACYMAMAQMWNLLGGYGGLVSIGQQAFIGIGGYSLFVWANFVGVDPFTSVALGGIIAALFAVPISQLVFRLPGGAFAIGTWAIAEVLRLVVANTYVLGGGSGASLTALRGIDRATRESVTFWIAVAAAFGSVLLVYMLLRSRFGLALTAIRDSEVASRSQGIDVKKIKFLVYVISSFGFGIAGALYFLANIRISPDAAFGISWSPLIIFMVIIGGAGTIEGPLIGAILFFVLSKIFEDYGTWYLASLGLLAVIVTIWFPKGLWGLVVDHFDLRLFPVQRRLRMPENK
ncbi:branched-chain amino acid ABC transporter permease [Sedimenticola selenatireducens]|uniref:branched-chain amino acid ABC transporter permease n=1 Tax=Sedimenticola selenatireducens TaxID=191960 RepID=UPI001FE1F24A|nr:branched-chain amino acid ABC transporter permease [Sedimenticola selenatireducens]